MQTYTRFKKITETKILLFGLMYGLLTIFVALQFGKAINPGMDF
jgi:hypothetical protein